MKVVKSVLVLVGAVTIALVGCDGTFGNGAEGKAGRGGTGRSKAASGATGDSKAGQQR